MPQVHSVLAENVLHCGKACEQLEPQQFPYLAVNSSNVSSSCPLLLLTLQLLNPAFADTNEVAGMAAGALLAGRKVGLRKEMVGVRAAIRNIEVDGISRRPCWVPSSGTLWCRLEEVPVDSGGGHVTRMEATSSN